MNKVWINIHNANLTMHILQWWNYNETFLPTQFFIIQIIANIESINCWDTPDGTLTLGSIDS